MTDPVPVQAGWAIWSKHQGTRDDYSVLAASAGPLSPGEFGQLLKYFTPGNPTADPGTAGSLPWAMLSRVGVSEQLYLGMSVQVLTGDKDGTGRPISRTSYFCIPYRELERSPVSYQNLYAAVAQPNLLPRTGGSLVPLEIPRLDPAALARIIRKFGETTVAATAALLLSGPVTITGPDHPDLHSRLRFFDAVAALLPYGYRPHLTAATWSDTAADDRFRIVFAHRGRDEASSVAWGTSPRLPAAGPAQAYLGYLQRALGRTGSGDGDEQRLERLIAYLAHETEPRKFEEPTQAIDSLHGFFLPLVVAESIDTNTTRIGDVRQLLAAGRTGELPTEHRPMMLRRLIAEGDPQDFGLISGSFDEIAAGQPGQLLADIAIVCRGQLWSAGTTGLSRDYLRLASQRNLADELLATLVTNPGSETDPTTGLDAVSKLLAELVIDAPAGTSSFPRTQRALAGNAPAGAALLANLSASRAGAPRLEEAIAWLEPVADRVVRPFVSLLGDAFGAATPEPVSAGMLYELNRDGGRASVRYLLRAASYRGRLHLALPGLASWLAGAADERAPVTEETSRYWRDVVMELSPASQDEGIWLDLILLLTRNGPQGLFSGRYGQPEFSQRLAAAWWELTMEAERHSSVGRATDELLENSLIEQLSRAPWRADQSQTAAVRNLARSLTAGSQRPRLMSVVLDTTEVLRQMPSGAPPARIAQACARAQAERLAPETAFRMLAESGAITSGAQAAAVLEELHRSLTAANTGTPAFSWPYEFIRMFTTGAFDRQVAVDFLRLTAAHCCEQIGFRIQLLTIILASAIPDVPPAIDAENAGYLESFAHDLDGMVKEVHRRQRGGLVGRFLGTGKGGPGDAVTQDGVTTHGGPGEPGGQE